MQKLLLLLIILPIFAFSAIDEYKTDVYFANGIFFLVPTLYSQGTSYTHAKGHHLHFSN